MNQDFLAVLEYMEKEKGINRKVMIEAIQAALVSACKKSLGPDQEVRVELDPKSGKVTAFSTYKVVENVVNKDTEIQLLKARQKKIDAQLGEVIEMEVPPKEFGRIAAQVFKQTINQTLRNIERTMIFDEFKDRAGTIVTGTVRRFDRSDVIIDLGKFEGIMPSRERVPTEEYTPGERIRAVVLSVDSGLRGPEIILSRAHPDFVRKLLELEVSELHDKAVEIKALAREPGHRTKIAVWSNDDKIDPVGACVGIRGARVKNIVRELNNEKIDLFRWSNNINELIIEALKPAKLKKLEIDPVTKKVSVHVDEENLSLAIGKRGQNARLASKLTGWEIDIQRDEKTEAMGFEQKLEQAAVKFVDALQVDKETAMAIVKAGFSSIDDLVEQSEEDVCGALPSLEPARITEIRAKVLSIKQTAAK